MAIMIPKNLLISGIDNNLQTRLLSRTIIPFSIFSYFMFVPFLNLDSFQKFRSRFIVRILRDEFAAEGFSEDGLGKLVHLGLGFPVPDLDPVGKGKEFFNATDDFVLFR